MNNLTGPSEKRQQLMLRRCASLLTALREEGFSQNESSFMCFMTMITIEMHNTKPDREALKKACCAVIDDHIPLKADANGG